MQKAPFHETLDQVLAHDSRYEREAYIFLREALEFAQKRQRKSRAPASTHVSAAELLDGFRSYTLQQFGPMSMTVLEYWGIRSTGDVGRMVFNLIGAGIFGRSEEDQIEDFENGFNFSEAFVEPFRPVGTPASAHPKRKPKLSEKTG